MVRVCILDNDGVEELDFVGVYEVLADVRKVSNYSIDVEVVTFHRRNVVKCRNGLVVVPHRVTKDFSECDVLVISGSKEFVEGALRDQRLLNTIKKFYEHRKLTASVCTGSLILAKAGIVRGKRATKYHLRLNMLQS